MTPTITKQEWLVAREILKDDKLMLGILGALATSDANVPQIAWDKFSNALLSGLPEDSAQYHAMRTAYLAGMMEMFSLFTESAVRLPEPIVEVFFTRMQKDLTDYFDEHIATQMPDADTH